MSKLARGHSPIFESALLHICAMFAAFSQQLLCSHVGEMKAMMKCFPKPGRSCPSVPLWFGFWVTQGHTLANVNSGLLLQWWVINIGPWCGFKRNNCGVLFSPIDFLVNTTSRAWPGKKRKKLSTIYTLCNVWWKDSFVACSAFLSTGQHFSFLDRHCSHFPKNWNRTPVNQLHACLVAHIYKHPCEIKSALFSSLSLAVSSIFWGKPEVLTKSVLMPSECFQRPVGHCVHSTTLE